MTLNFSLAVPAASFESASFPGVMLPRGPPVDVVVLPPAFEPPLVPPHAASAAAAMTTAEHDATSLRIRSSES